MATKRTTTHVFCGISLDGFIALAQGELDFLDPFGDDDAGAAYEEFVSRIDVFVFGRATFEKVMEFDQWPFKKPVYILSRSLSKLPRKYARRAEILSLPPAGVVKFLAAKGFAAAYIDGGKVIQSFLNAGLVDTITISRVPVLIGDGIPLFGSLDADVHLEHLRTKVNGNGLVMREYRVKPRKPKKKAAGKSSK